MIHKKLNIGFYLPDLTNAENSGSLTFFEVLFQTLNSYPNITNNRIFIFCENLNNLKEKSADNVTVVRVNKSREIVKLTKLEHWRYRFGSWLVSFCSSLFININLSNLADGLQHQSMQSKIEDIIDQNSIDLMIYANQFELPTVNRPYIWILWDMGCQTINFFHKPNDSSQTLNLLKKASSNAFRIISGNQTGAEEISFFLNFPKERIRSIPFPVPQKLLDVAPKLPSKKFCPYIFYPALLVPFKNHAVVLEALKILHQENIPLHFVMTGVDKGNLAHILSLSKELGVESFVHYLGVVTIEELRGLYQQAEALVFPSLLGPNNFPPLEALALGTPALVSNLKGHQEQLEDKVLYFDPLCPSSLVSQIKRLKKEDNLREKLIKNGQEFVRDLTPKKYLESLLSCADEFLPYSKNWEKFV